MPPRRLPWPESHALSTAAAHHPFAETPRRPTASATTPLAALRGRLLAGLPVSPIAFSAAVARADPDTLPALHGLARDPRRAPRRQVRVDEPEVLRAPGRMLLLLLVQRKKRWR